MSRFHSVVRFVWKRSAQNQHCSISAVHSLKFCRQQVDFIWVVKNQRNLEWFVELLEELDAEQQKEERFHNFLEIQIYLTSSTKMNDIHAFALTSALETFYQKYNRDLITGIAARARHGRPNWEDVSRFPSRPDNFYEKSAELQELIFFTN